MKRLSTLVASFLLVSVMNAQVSITEAPDFELTDIHGDSHHLYDLLDEGKYVMIDLYAYWCGPCCATAPEIKQVFEEYGCNSGDLYVIGLEADGTTAQTENFENSCGSADGHPVVSGIDGGASEVVDQYGPIAFPTIILIAPDRTIIEQDIWPFSSEIADGILEDLGVTKQECALVSSTEDVPELIQAIELAPSPFTDELNVRFELPASADVRVELLNNLGQVVQEQATARLGVGAHQFGFKGATLAAGIYFVRITIDEQTTLSRKVVKQ